MMSKYKITHLSGDHDVVDDERSLEELTAALCQEGYLIVSALKSIYTGEFKPVALMEMAIAKIEPV